VLFANLPQNKQPLYHGCFHDHHHHHHHHHHCLVLLVIIGQLFDIFLLACHQPQDKQPFYLTEEERRTLIAEGLPVPAGLPLTKVLFTLSMFDKYWDR